MQAGSWIALLRRIPASQHDNLMVVTATGTELMVQKIVRLEEEFLIIRGRHSGSTDQGRVMMIPYTQLNYLAFQKALLEKEIQAIFGNLAGESEFAQIAGLTEAAAEEPVLAEIADDDDEEAAAPAPQASSKPKPPSKSVLLARLRERLANGDKSM
jgi:hypothetical protein